MSYILTTDKIKQILDDYGLPCSYSHFNEPTQPPFVTWLVTQTNNFNADNIVYQNIPTYEVYLYSRVDIINEELKFEKYLTEQGLIWDKTSETWIDEEKVMMTIYELS